MVGDREPDRDRGAAGGTEGHRIIVEPQPLHDAGAEVLDYHVDRRDHAPDQSEVVLVLQVGGQALLVAVHGVERDGVTVLGDPGEGQLPPDVPHRGALDLYNSGPEVAEAERRHRPGQELTEIEHGGTGERRAQPFTAPSMAPRAR